LDQAGELTTLSMPPALFFACYAHICHTFKELVTMIMQYLLFCILYIWFLMIEMMIWWC